MSNSVSTGQNSGYNWLATEGDDLHTLLTRCPETVLGKYIAITSFDSGALQINEQETAAGWTSKGSIAYSPQIQLPGNLPHDLYDEWYVFNEPRSLGELVPANQNIFENPLRQMHVQVFVNFGGFHLHKPDSKPIGDLFWEQMAWINPDSYIADGECLCFVTSNNALFIKVKEMLGI